MIIGNPKVSILLTSYNNPMVKDTIGSVFDQTYKNWELILLDDNSNEKIQKIYAPYLKDPRVIYYNSHIKEEDRLKECPYARQINIGLKMATGKLITYLCDDVVYLSKKLETMVRFLKWHPFVKVCYNRQDIVFGKEVVEKALRKSPDQKMIDFLKEHPTVKVRTLSPDRILRDPFCRVDHNSVMHYKSCIDVIGNWDTKSFAMADAYFWRKLGQKFLFYPIREVLETHYGHEKSFSSQIFLKKVKAKYE